MRIYPRDASALRYRILAHRTRVNHHLYEHIVRGPHLETTIATVKPIRSDPADRDEYNKIELHLEN